MIWRLAPSWLHATWRTSVFVVALSLVGGAMYLFNGPPTVGRVYRQNELARFAPELRHGLVQLAGETGLVVLVAWIGRTKLKVRL